MNSLFCAAIAAKTNLEISVSHERESPAYHATISRGGSLDLYVMIDSGDLDLLSVLVQRVLVVIAADAAYNKGEVEQ